MSDENRSCQEAQEYHRALEKAIVEALLDELYGGPAKDEAVDQPSEELTESVAFSDEEVDTSWMEEDSVERDASTYGAAGYYGRRVERIDAFLEQLGRFWKELPDWRFGQLMCNLDRFFRAHHNDCDFFYLEEDEFLEFLESYRESLKQRRGW